MPDVLETWDASLEALSQAVREISEDALDGASEEGRARTVWAVLSAAAQYVVNFRSQDPYHPQFTPLLNDVFNSNPNPDFMYRLARVRGDLHYVIEGTRGTSRFVEVQQMAGLDGSMSGAGRLLGRFSLDEIELDAEGGFRIDLGPGAPPASTSNWIGLHPR